MSLFAKTDDPNEAVIIHGGEDPVIRAASIRNFRLRRLDARFRGHDS
jgi:hypothetical protein